MQNVDVIVDVYKNYGFLGVIIGITISMIAVASYSSIKRLAIKLVDKYFPSNNPNKGVNPLKAVFFDKMDVLIFYKVPRMLIHCPLRKAVFSKLLQIAFEVWKKNVREKAIDVDVDTLENAEYHNFWRSLVYRTTDDWEARSLKEGVPEVAVVKYREVHKKTLTLMLGIIEQICTSTKVYPTNTEKTIAILDFIAILLDMALIDAETTVSQVNGELSKQTFEGITCVQCDIQCEYRAVQE